MNMLNVHQPDFGYLTDAMIYNEGESIPIEHPDPAQGRRRDRLSDEEGPDRPRPHQRRRPGRHRRRDGLLRDRRFSASRTGRSRFRTRSPTTPPAASSCWATAWSIRAMSISTPAAWCWRRTARSSVPAPVLPPSARRSMPWPGWPTPWAVWASAQGRRDRDSVRFPGGADSGGQGRQLPRHHRRHRWLFRPFQLRSPWICNSTANARSSPAPPPASASPSPRPWPPKAPRSSSTAARPTASRRHWRSLREAVPRRPLSGVTADLATRTGLRRAGGGLPRCGHPGQQPGHLRPQALRRHPGRRLVAFLRDQRDERRAPVPRTTCRR
jgi:hypothetical protein